jgi:hypothetical protein
MSFKTEYPTFASIETQVKRARLERSVAIADFLSDVIVKTVRGTQRLGTAWLEKGLDTWARGLSADRDKRAVEADVFVKRWVH